MVQGNLNKKRLGAIASVLALPLLAFAPGGSAVRANLFQGIVLLAAAGLVAGLVRRSLRELGFQRGDFLAAGLALAALCGAGVLLIVLFFRGEQDIKIYDSTNYWIRVIADRERIARSIPEYLSFLRGTLSQEYSHLAVFPLLPFSYLFGVSFSGYCLSVFVAYYLPGCLLLALLALRLLAPFQQRKARGRELALGLALCALCPALLWPVLLGYLDVCGVVLTAALLHTALGWNTLRFSLGHNLKMAALSLSLVLVRRWYAYYIVGFYAALGVLSLVRAFRVEGKSSRRLAALAANFAAVAGAACLGALTLNPAIFSLFLGRDYATAYAAFKGVGALRSLWYLANHMGLLWVAAFLLGLVLLLQKPEARLESMHLVLAAGTGALLFLAVQDMGPHHQYLVIPTLLIFAVSFVVLMLRKLSGGDVPLACAGAAAVLLLNAGFAFFPGLEGAADFGVPLTTSLRIHPVRLANYDAYHQIHRALEQKGDGRAASVYVVGEGAVLNPEYLRRLNMPAEEDAAPYVSVNNTVDLRDGFPSQLFMADRVLVAEPFSTDFAQAQQVSYQVYDMLLNDPAMAAHYTLEEAFPLEEHQALLFRKLGPVNRAAVDLLRARLKAHYPGDPFVYEPNYFLALIQCDQTLVEYNHWESFLRFQKPAAGQVTFALGDTGSFSRLRIDVLCQEPGLELVVEDQRGEVYRAVISAGTAAHQVDFAGSQFLAVSFVGEAEGAVTVYYRGDSLR